MSEDTKEPDISKIVSDETFNKTLAETMKEIEEKNPDFMKGYVRDIKMTGKLLGALVKCMDRHPDLRLGQLLYCVVSISIGRGADDDKIGATLFNLYDERLIEALDAF